MTCTKRWRWSFAHLVACGVVALLLFTLRTADAAPIFDNTNKGAVVNGPTAPTVFTLAAPTAITLLYTYHWDGGTGPKPGTIGLRDANGATYIFPAVGSPGQNGAPNVNWTATVAITIPAGTYTVIDSSNATWSQNAQSGGSGFARVEGVPVVSGSGGVVPPAPMPSLSHFKCYDVVKPVQPRSIVLLTDQFQRNARTAVLPAELLCTPVTKRLVNAEPLPVPRPADHLLCYLISGDQVSQRRAVANQLQRTSVVVLKPHYLCVPTNKAPRPLG